MNGESGYKLGPDFNIKIHGVLTDIGNALQTKAEAAYQQYRQKTENCLSKSRLLRIAAEERHIVTKAEQSHIDGCRHCNRIIQSLSKSDRLS